MEIRKAVRKKAKLRLGIAAPSGHGKSFSALQIASGIGGKIGMIDTENGSGDLYADAIPGGYDIITLQAPFTPARYIDAIKAFEKEGYTTIIIDSLTHAWAGEGGSLDKHGKLADSGDKNSYAAWRKVTPEHNRLVETMLQSPCHIIATMRAKTEYVLETNSRGKQVPVKVGMAPVMRDGIEYEFTVFFELDNQHNAFATKDRTRLFDDYITVPTPEMGQRLLGWLENGIEAPTPESWENEQVRLMKDIREAATLADLKTAYEAAVSRAKEKEDPEAYQAFNKATAAVKAKLEAPAASGQAQRRAADPQRQMEREQADDRPTVDEEVRLLEQETREQTTDLEG